MCPTGITSEITLLSKHLLKGKTMKVETTSAITWKGFSIHNQYNERNTRAIIKQASRKPSIKMFTYFI